MKSNTEIRRKNLNILTFHSESLKMAKYTLKIFRSSHRKILKVFFVIFQHYA